MLSVILPASNEADYIGACLQALFAGHKVPGGAEVVVVANGCTDATATIARGYADAAAAAGWGLQVLDLPRGGKIGALNAGDAAARGDLRAYLDADVLVSPALMAELAGVLAAASGPLYASGTPVVARARSAVTRAYACFWQTLPFVRSVAPGFGLFAVNAAGRARWAAFPPVISDDTFVRIHFRPAERVQIAATYSWPMIEGFRALVRVRRRQDAGVQELLRLRPDLMLNEGKAPLTPAGLIARALRHPLGFAAYAAVSIAVRMRRGGTGWTRGR